MPPKAAKQRGGRRRHAAASAAARGALDRTFSAQEVIWAEKRGRFGRWPQAASAGVLRRAGPRRLSTARPLRAAPTPPLSSLRLPSIISRRIGWSGARERATGGELLLAGCPCGPPAARCEAPALLQPWQLHAQLRRACRRAHLAGRAAAAARLQPASLATVSQPAAGSVDTRSAARHSHCRPSCRRLHRADRRRHLAPTARHQRLATNGWPPTAAAELDDEPVPVLFSTNHLRKWVREGSEAGFYRFYLLVGRRR